MTDMDIDQMVDDIFDQGEEENPAFRYKKKPGKMAISENLFDESEAIKNPYYPKYFTRKSQDRTQGQPITDYTETIKLKYCKKCGVSNIEDNSLNGKAQICDTCRNPEGY